MIRRLALLSFLLCLGACASFRPVPMNTDPNVEARERMDQRNDEAWIEAFIAAHPDFDSQTKKELRSGRINTREALRRHPPK